MSHYHVVVWIDHKQARVFHFNADEAEKIVVHPDRPIKDYHRKRSDDSSHNPEDQVFLEEVTSAISDGGAILIVGPANEKLELMKHIQRKHPQLVVKIEGVEAADHPSDGEIVAHARRFMSAADRIRPS